MNIKEHSKKGAQPVKNEYTSKKGNIEGNIIEVPNSNQNISYLAEKIITSSSEYYDINTHVIKC